VAAPLCLGPEAEPTAPVDRLPEGSVDAHCHVFAPGYALVEGRSYTPAPAPLAAYLAMCEAIGITRTVQVNASVYGFDNQISLDVIAELGQHRARGVAGVAPDVGHAELERLHRGGMRGVRLSTHVAGYGGTELIDALASRLAPFGWHVQVHVAGGAELAGLEDRLMRVPVPLVFDHLGCVRGSEGAASAGFQALLRLLQRRDDCWVKISSWYRRSDAGAPAYADMKPLAQALIAARPDRVVYGTNWPHPNLFTPETVPRDADLARVFCDWVPDAGQRKRILVQNAETLYGFDPA
jgi:2-pyrone-4,6-dicarboxylate lactonase